MTNTIDEARELAVTRIYRAPRALVLEMWSDPARLANWWGPVGFSTTTHEMDFRPGGVWRFTMHGPDGAEYPNFIRYVATGPDRIAYDHSAEGDVVDFHVEVALAEIEKDKTRLDFRLIFPTAEERKRIVEKSKADKGLSETLTRLDAILAERQAEENPFRLILSQPSPTRVRMTRSFRAPRTLVFDAFTKAEHVQNWQAPYIYKFTECSFDARPGGQWHMVQVAPDGKAYRFQGDVIDVAYPERLVTTFEFEGMRECAHTNFAAFEETDGVTRVTMDLTFPTQEDRDAMVATNMEWGAGQSFDRLEKLVMFAFDDPEHPRFSITRTLRAPRELIWQAWSEAHRLAKWWGPAGCELSVSQLDFEPGGLFLFGMAGHPHGTLWGRFIYREISPTERIVFVNSFSDENGGVTRAPFSENWPLAVLNELTLADCDGGTLMHLEGAPLTDSADELKQFASFFDSMSQGFGGTFDQLEAYLAEAER